MEDGPVYYYSVPMRLITPEVVAAVDEGGLGVLFLEKEDRSASSDDEVAGLPLCLQVLVPEIKPVEGATGEQWGGIHIQGPWASVLPVYQWN